MPTIMNREEVVQVLDVMNGDPQLVVKLIYGGGLRMMEAIRLRVQDLDFDLKQIVVRFGKGGKDRVTPLPFSLTPLLHNHLARVRVLHERDIAAGYGEVYLPYALNRKHLGRRKNLVGSMFSRQESCPEIPEAAKYDAIILAAA